MTPSGSQGMVSSHPFFHFYGAISRMPFEMNGQKKREADRTVSLCFLSLSHNHPWLSERPEISRTLDRCLALA